MAYYLLINHALTNQALPLVTLLNHYTVIYTPILS